MSEPSSTSTARTDGTDEAPSSPVLILLAWMIVVVPLAYGLWQTLVKAAQLLGG